MDTQPTVFVVDDDHAVRKALTLSLKKRGWSVESYESAEAFLTSHDVDRPGCLVLDVQMPGMSGLELQDALTARHCNIPIIFVTGHGDIPMSVRAIKRGAIEFLEKPYRQGVLLGRIEEALAQDARNRQKEVECNAIKARFERLTAREKEVMALLVAGAANASNKQIARQLDISYRTVDNHRARVMEKMQAQSVPDLVDMAKLCGVYKSTD
ncbi:MAG: response regulator [Gammaproteobacteria bacterium]|nr:response regulator [Gammaproteobacteria bacterium]